LVGTVLRSPQKLLIASGAFLILGFLSITTLPQVLINTSKAEPVSCDEPHTTETCLNLGTTGLVDFGHITPTTTGTTATVNATINVRTNAPGYDLKFSTASTTNTLNHNPVFAPTNYTISPTTTTALDINSWGYSTNSGTTFSAVPTSTAPVTLKSTTTANDTLGEDTTITYGLKVNDSQASGTYQTTLLYTALTNSFPVPTIASVVTSTGAGVTANYTVKSNGEWPDSTIGANRNTRTVAITGTNFYDVSAVSVGGTACTSFTVNSNVSITCTLATTVKTGSQVVVVTAPGGATSGAAVNGTNAIVYVAAPTVASVSSTTAKTNGQLPDTLAGTAWTAVTSTTNTITGANFQGAGSPAAATTAVISAGGFACTNSPLATISSAISITCNQPNWGSAGAKAVQVSNAYGASGTATTVTAMAAPTLASISPTYGSATGGTSITLTGGQFNSTFTTTVGGANCATKAYVSVTSSTCITPAGTAGARDVVTRTPYGSATLTGGFTYRSDVIVPSIASTVVPTGNGTGTNGPQFSISVSPAVASSPTPTVTIGGLACINVVVNTAGTAITCTGPVASLTTGAKAVAINGITTPAVVTYNSTAYPTLQSLVAVNCTGTAAAPTVYRDTRDSQLYHVARMADNKCWMLDNLKYRPNGDTSGTANATAFSAIQQANTGSYLTTDGTVADAGAVDPDPRYDSPKYVDPIAAAYCRGNTDISPENITKCGFLYNLYTANAGTIPYTQTTAGSTGTGSICPTNWHLPTGRGNASDFALLNIAAGGTGGTTTPSSQANLDLWWPDGAWRGVFSGYFNTTFTSTATAGQYWSSVVASLESGYRLNFSAGNTYPGTFSSRRHFGAAVRCVLQNPAPTIASVVTATGAGVTANYTVKSNGEWPNATIGTARTTRTVAINGANFYDNTGSTTGTAGISITVGGTACASFTHTSATLLTCTLATTTKSGSQVVVVTTPGGTTTGAAVNGTNAIVYVAVPIVTSVSPNTAKLNGSDPDNLSGTTWTAITTRVATIAGTLFQGAAGTIAATTATVTMDGIACTTPTIVSAISITCSKPSAWATAGNKLVQVNNAYGSSVSTTVNINAIAAPSISSISPNSGLPIAGGTTITLTGSGFQSTFTTTVGGTDCTTKTYSSATTSTCVTPAKAAGSSQSVVTRTAYGTSGGVNVTYVSAPTITGVVTATGAGVTANYTVKSNGEWPNATIGAARTTRTVAITGSNFTGATAVTVGGTACTSFTVNSAASITCTLATTAKSGAQVVVVTTPGGTTSGAASNGVNAIVYVDAPTVTAASPNTAKVNGQGPDTLSGNAWTAETSLVATITGTNLNGATYATTATVTMAGIACTTPSIASATFITCNRPTTWGTAGNKAVQVNNAYGSSGTTINVNAIAGPTLTSVSPATGSTLGGTNITLTGTNFNSTFTVSVAGFVCTNPIYSSATSSTCVTPAGTAGAQNVITRTPYGSATLASGFTYIAPPTVTAIVPNIASTTAPTGNGTGTNGPQFSIAGTNFGAAPTVTIGGLACTNVVVNSAGTAITCTGPVASLTTGAKTVAINGTNTTASVTYNNTAYPTLQSLTGATCTGTATTPTVYRDTRDSQLYYVAKLADNKCWMLDNLRFKPNGNTTGSVTNNFTATQVANTGQYLSTDGTQPSTSAADAKNDAAKYVDPISVAYCYGTTDISPQNITKCGFLYNFYTANAGTVPYDQYDGHSTGSICPANWHLPTATSTTTGPDYGLYYNFADFAVLNVSMNAGIFTTPGDTTNTFFAGWQPTGAWRGVFSGAYFANFSNQGASGNGAYWSSSTSSYAAGRNLYFSSSNVNPGGNPSYSRYSGFAVRCVIDTPPPAPTVTSITPNSGHFRGGETVTITGTNFTGATVVRVGGNAAANDCRSFTVVSATQITCVTAGIGTSYLNSDQLMTNITNAVSVYVITPLGTATGTNLFTYRYPNSSFTGSGTFLNVLTTDVTFGSKISVGGTDCLSPTIISPTAMSCTSPNLAAGARALAITAPPASQGNMQNWTGCSAIATPPYTTTNWAPYTRVLTDTRNGQMYRIRKLPDGKCWMIDNLKLATPGTALTITPANSNVTANFTIPANPIQAAADHNANGRCDASGITLDQGTGYQTCDGTESMAAYVAGNPNTDNFRFAGYSDPSTSDNSDSCQPGVNGTASDTLTACGYLYNWYTTTAGTGDQSLNTSGMYASASICPAGWHLPNNTATNDFAVLNAAMYNGSTIASGTSNADHRKNWYASGPFSGSFANSFGRMFDQAGDHAFWWGARGGSNLNASGMQLTYNTLLSGIYAKYFSRSVRCISN